MYLHMCLFIYLFTLFLFVCVVCFVGGEEGGAGFHALSSRSLGLNTTANIILGLL